MAGTPTLDTTHESGFTVDRCLGISRHGSIISGVGEGVGLEQDHSPTFISIKLSLIFMSFECSQMEADDSLWQPLKGTAKQKWGEKKDFLSFCEICWCVDLLRSLLRGKETFCRFKIFVSVKVFCTKNEEKTSRSSI